METVILTGEKRSGKTTWIMSFARFLKGQSIPFFGITTPKIFDREKVVGITVLDFYSGHSLPLASKDGLPGIRQGQWRFYEEGLAFAEEACNPQSHQGLCIIDEIGPLEFKGQGLANVFKWLNEGRYDMTLLSVRQELAKECSQILVDEPEIIQFKPDLTSVEICRLFNGLFTQL